ncbi:alpha/beta fold hydrolase [Pontibacillus marinus]|uniref:Hydrolase n=1 Tax=Pontibacillus marinus BH030004 = DSM 16465 TaxID=1385511 RepID=A0A0A5G199_9BACI|nr:alpha/beta hydrolase [Pontibacillus marinus]KGX84878.1 hydrolase [Pontibacillus marinus BH030004 = DSM 16465]
MLEEKTFYYSEKQGRGFPVLFLPAAGFLGNEGQNIADVILDDFQTHLLDLPGMGRGQGIKKRCTTKEMAEWVKGYLDQEGIDQVHVIGHSLGGALGMAFAAHYPKRVSKLVLLDQGHKPFPRIPKNEFGPFAYAFPVLSGAVRLFGRPILQKLEPLFAGSPTNYEDRDIDQEVHDFCEQFNLENTAYIRKAKEIPAEFSVDGLNLMFGYYQTNLPKLLKRIESKTFLAYATFKEVDEKEQRYTQKYIKSWSNGGELSLRSVNGGHYVHWADEGLLTDIHDFLKGT